MTAIHVDAAEQISDAPHTESTGETEFLKRLMPSDAETPSDTEDAKKTPANAGEDKADTETKETDEAAAEEPAADAETEETEAEKAAALAARKYADEGAYVKVKVGDEVHEVPVKDLERLFGQEKALTQKSMEASTQRTAADAELQKNVAATGALLDRAKARFEPFSKVDFLLAAKELSAEDYTNLRNAAASAYEDVQFLEQNLNSHMQAAQTKQNETLVTQAKEALKVLSGPAEKGGIEGWTEALYNDIRGFAVSQGLDKNIVNQLVDPVAIKMLYNAMLFTRGQSKVITTKVNKTPTKVVKTTTPPAAARVTDSSANVKKALKNLQETGSTDSAADAFMARWKDNDADE
jgi:hypothetical protein